jgi:hypothetical protein
MTGRFVGRSDAGVPRLPPLTMPTSTRLPGSARTDPRFLVVAVNAVGSCQTFRPSECEGLRAHDPSRDRRDPRRSPDHKRMP